MDRAQDASWRRPSVSLVPWGMLFSSLSTAFRFVAGGAKAGLAKVDVPCERNGARTRAARGKPDGAAILDATGFGWFLLEPSSARLTASRRFCELVDLSIGDEADAVFPVRHFLDRVHPDDVASVESALFRRSPEAFSQEFRLHDQGGAERWRMLRGAAARRSDVAPDAVMGLLHDIGPRKRSEQAAREADARARLQLVEVEALYRNAPLGMAILDRDLRFVRINETLAAINGLTVEEHIGRNAWDVVPAIRESAEPFIEQVFASGQPVRDIHVVGETPREPGVLREWCEHFYPITDGEDRVVGVGVIADEVTEQRRLERLAADRQNRIDRLLSSNVVGIMTVDDSRVLDANDMFLQLIGYDREDLRAGLINWRRMTPPEFAEVDALAMEELRVHGACRPFAKRFIRKDGVEAPVMIGATRFGAGEDAEYVCFAVDMSDRERAEEAIRAGSKMLELVLDNLSSFVAVLTLEGRVVAVNDWSLRELGLKREDVVGRELWDAGAWRDIPDARDLLRASFASALRGEVARHDIATASAGGDRLMLDFTLSVIRDSMVNPTHVVASALDVTERRQREDAVHALLRELSHRANNLLAIVSAAVRNLVREEPNPRAFERRLSSRIQTLASVQGLLVRNDWRGLDLADLIQALVEQHEAVGRIAVSGPRLMLTVGVAQHLALSIDEILDACRYEGALSTVDDVAELRWSVDRSGRLELTWSEAGGQARPLAEKRLGRKGLARLLPEALGAQADYSLGPSGLTWRVSLDGGALRAAAAADMAQAIAQDGAAGSSSPGR